jgi:hypothetical protein
MRVLPLVERALLAALALLALAALAFLLTWHQRWRAILDRAAALPPHPGVARPVAVPVPAEVARDFLAWYGESRHHYQLDTITTAFVATAPLGPGEDDLAPGLWVDPDPRGSFVGSHGPVPRGLLDPDLADRLRLLLARGLRLGQHPAPVAIADAAVAGSPDDSLTVFIAEQLCAGAAARWRADAAADRAAWRATRPGPAPADAPRADTRGESLDALDALVAALGPRSRAEWGHCLFTGVIGTLRDAAYLDAQLAGALPAARLARWRAEDADARAPLLVGIDCARRWWTPEHAASLVATAPWSWSAGSGWSGHLAGLAAWWSFSTDDTRTCAALGRDLDAIAAGEATRSLSGFYPAPQALAIASSHRFALLASAIAAGWAAGRTPEACGLDLGAGPAAGGGRAALVLTALGNRRWTITLAPAQTPPLGTSWLALDDPPLDQVAATSGAAFVWSARRLLVTLTSPARPDRLDPESATAAHPAPGAPAPRP